MMPGGHLATSAALGAGAYTLTGSLPLAAGCFAGGFLIDVDHYLDYILFERQWAHPGPAAFLRHYFRNELKRVVLPLHSLELMFLLTLIVFLRPHPFLAGYVLGAAMHLAFDVAINGDYAIRNRYRFYFFAYRAHNSFDASRLLQAEGMHPETGSHPFREFFKWRPSFEKLRRSPLKKEHAAEHASPERVEP